MARRAHISTLDASRRSRRQAGQAPQRTVILIVCEGQTEEAYFQVIKEHYRSNKTLNLTIKRAAHSDPVKVVEEGKTRNNNRDFDQVYCVIDGDKPDRIAKARARAAARDDLDPVVSTPCFEVWLLMHFERSDAPFAGCAQVCNHLRRSDRLPDYAKGSRYDFAPLTGRIDAAVENAKWLAAQGQDSPATDLHRLLARIRPAP